ncbi:unnamed protein product [Fraxinus pennsylvanica]|uniref:Uncharacterized protein n=1 Tax=Fraxinus pennsylvanica TaxID=56036 RepID=A0AAD1YSF0_9LAMI|nr:unnamed protein product [Fraxinus pennsylvanica]
MHGMSYNYTKWNRHGEQLGAMSGQHLPSQTCQSPNTSLPLARKIGTRSTTESIPTCRAPLIETVRTPTHPEIPPRTLPNPGVQYGTSSDNLDQPPSRHMSAIRHHPGCKRGSGEGQLAILIGQSGAIPILLRVLPNSDESFRKGLLKCLRTVVTFEEPNRLIIASNGGTEIVLNMLDSCSDDSMLILLEILSALTLKRQVRKLILSSGGVWFLVESARARLVNAGAIPVLMQLINDGEMSMKLVTTNALGVILTDVDNIWPIAESGVIPLCTELHEGLDPIGREIAGYVLHTLAMLNKMCLQW